jgi:hypothetical protein
LQEDPGRVKLAKNADEQMNFPIDRKKATQAVARLIEKSGGPMDYLRLSKLIYLADRESIRLRGIPIVGGRYYSMRQGPVIGEVMHFVGARNAPGWSKTISPRYGNEIRLEKAPEFGALSQTELEILDETLRRHSSRTTDELVDWCHKHCAEYEHVTGRGRKAIRVESILKAVGKNAAKIRALVQEAESLAELDHLLT